jgi:hypothetical protein
MIIEEIKEGGTWSLVSYIASLELYTSVLKGSDDGVLHLEESCFWTLSIICFFGEKHFGNWICFRLMVK